MHVGKRLTRFLTDSRADVAVAIATVAGSSGTLAYPFGRDQGLYYYVGREWALRGAVPYRDLLDHKTPGIYILHALLVRLFGERMWAIRVADLVALLLLGLASARIATPVRRPVPPFLFAAAHLAASILFFGYLNFWDVAQSELWYATLSLGSLAAARHVEKPDHACLAAGLALGAALVMKPLAIVFVPVLVTLTVLRTREEAASTLSARASLFGRKIAITVAGAGSVIALVIGYFAAKGALGAMRDIVIGANGHYVAHERGVDRVADIPDRIQAYLGRMQPFSAIAIIAVVSFVALACKRRDFERLERWGTAGAVVLLGLTAVTTQQKFYLLHFGVMTGPWTVALAAVAYEVQSADVPIGRATRALAVTAGVIVLFALSGGPAREWFDTQGRVLRHLRGKTSREEYAASFRFPDIQFDYGDSERVGLWLRAHSGPDDRVAVRGFDPEIYAVAQRRHAGRFFWTTFLTHPARAYRRAEWLAEDRADLDTHPPRFAVVHREDKTGPESEAYFPGYVRRFESGRFIVLERP
jgi:hypothetical protein